MRFLIATALLAAMAAPALGQDSSGNRLNHPYPEAKREACVCCPSAEAGLFPSENRLNAGYRDRLPPELTGGPSPYGNRMNLAWTQTQPKAQPKPEPKEIEKEPTYPTPQP
jgi:hypothetical protein